MNETIQIWLAYCQRYCTRRTCQQYQSVLNMFYMFCKTYPTPNDINDYIDKLRDNHSNRTINNQIMVLRSFCRWCANQLKLENPLLRFRPLPVSTPKRRVLTDREYRQVLSICTHREVNMIQFLGNTGLRVSEFLNMRPNWISPCRTYLTVQGKGRKERTVPLNCTCLKILQEHPDYQIAPNCSIWRTCQDIAKRAGIPAFGPHALRHYFATRLIRAGVPLIKVSQTLGHSSALLTEKIYVHLLPVDYIGVTNCLPD